MYFPTTEHTVDEVENMYEDITELINMTSKRDFRVIMGDSNAKTKGLEQGNENIMGGFLAGTHNDRGAMLKNICHNHDLTISKTLYKRRFGRLWTWKSPDGETKNIIGDKDSTTVVVDGSKIENVSHFKYLGTTLTNDGSLVEGREESQGKDGYRT